MAHRLGPLCDSKAKGPAYKELSSDAFFTQHSLRILPCIEESPTDQGWPCTPPQTPETVWFPKTNPRRSTQNGREQIKTHERHMFTIDAEDQRCDGTTDTSRKFSSRLFLFKSISSTVSSAFDQIDEEEETPGYILNPNTTCILKPQPSRFQAN
jgi:hypothetical protein